MTNVSRPAAGRSIWRNASYLISGTVLSQGIQFLASLVLARLFVPADFGAFAAALGVATVLGVLIVLSYPNAIPLADTDEEARALTWVSLLLAVMLTAPILVVLLVLALSEVPVFGTRVDWWYALFVPAASIALAAFATMQRTLSRHDEFRSIGTSTAIGALVQVVTQLGLGMAGAGAVGLAVGYLAGRVVNVALMMRKARLGRPPSARALLDSGRTWSSRTRWLLVASTMNLIGTSALAPWVHLLYGDQVAGSFAFALMTLSVPAAMIGQALSTILFPKMAALERSEALGAERVYAYVVGLTSIAFPIFLPFLILGTDIFQIVYGDEWRVAGLIATLLVPVLAVNFVSSPVSSVAVVQGKFRQTTFLAVIDAVLRLCAIAIGGSTGSVTLGFALYSLVGAAFYVSYLAWLLRLVGGSLVALVQEHWVRTSAAALAMTGLLLARPAASLALLVPLTGAVCAVSLWFALRRHLPRDRFARAT